MKSSNLKFSVIIPVRRINDFMCENITYLKKLEHKNFEVLILVDFEEDYDFEGDDRFKIILVPGQKGPGEKRNIGAENATGDILAFLDDDAYPQSDWLTHAAEIFTDENVYALGAPAMTPPTATFLEKLGGRVLESWLTSAGTVFRHIPGKPRLINDYPTVNLLVRKNAFDKVGGFYTEFWPGEDTKLCLDLIQEFGRDFHYDPRPIVYHHRRDLLRPHLKQISRYGQHRGQFARIFPETSRLPSYFIPSLFVLGLCFGPFISMLIPFLWKIYFSALLLYFGLVTVEAVRLTDDDEEGTAFAYVFVGIFATHIIYGVNFMIGFLRRPTLKLKAIDTKTGNYSEG
jgi:cellulose synthase/poly-beta-1,6-N-acetylglucosamine synthase-like glycosyltransferase